MRHAVIWGRRRQGKSTLALALAILSRRSPVIIFDPCGQFGAYPIYASPEQGIEETCPIFRTGVDGDPDKAFQQVMDELDGGSWDWGEYALIVDEASFLQKPQFQHPALARLIRQAPDDITVIQTLHRPSETHPTVRGLATDLFFFHQYLQRDLEVIEANYGPEIAAAVSKLPEHHVIHWWLGPGGVPVWKTWDKPEEWHIPIGATAMPKEAPKEDDSAPLEQPIAPNDTDDHQTAPDAPNPAQPPVKTNPEDDPIRELLRVNKREIERLSKQNKKLRERVRNSLETKPLTGKSDGDNLSTDVPPAQPGPEMNPLWHILTGE